MSNILKGLTENSLADQIMAIAKAKGMNARIAGTPEQERERTQQMMAQRTKDRENQEHQAAQEDFKILDQLKDEYAKMSERYKALGGSNWQYADREQNLSDNERKARSMEPQMRDLGARIARAEKVQGLTEEQCPECGGPMFSELLINEKKDACYYKVKSRYKVWPSAYASGALVKCRKKGASNWGNKSEGVAEGFFGIDDKIKGKIQNIVSRLSDEYGMWDHKAQTFTPDGLEHLKSILKFNDKYIKYALSLTSRDFEAEGVAEGSNDLSKYNDYPETNQDPWMPVMVGEPSWKNIPKSLEIWARKKGIHRDIQIRHDPDGRIWTIKGKGYPNNETVYTYKWLYNTENNKFEPIPDEQGVAEGLSDIQKKIEDTILKLEQRLKFAKTAEQWDNIKNRIERLQAGLNRSKKGVAEGSLNEFAPDDSNDSEEDNLHKYAKMWYNGDDATRLKVEQILDRMGWEVGPLESEEGGAFVVQAGDEDGDTYIGFTPEELSEQLDENLRQWFKEKWVRFGPDGKIRGACARGDDSEGKPKCLPQSKAHSLGKKGRASAAARKRREDPNPERSGKAINVNTKKKTNEEQLDELKCWPGYTRVRGVPAGAPGSCKKKTSEGTTANEKEADYGPEYQDMVKRVGQKAKQGERKTMWDPEKRVYKTVPVQQTDNELSEDWQKVNKSDRTDGMSRKAVKAYRRENPGSKLKTAVTTKPSKLKKGSKSAKRRKSFCARMKGMKKAHASAKTKRNPDSPINKALRRWNCESVEQMQELIMIAEQKIRQLREAANPAQQAAIAINMKKAGKKPKNLKESKDMCNVCGQTPCNCTHASSIMQGIRGH